MRISPKSFFLGMGLGMVLVTSINLINYFNLEKENPVNNGLDINNEEYSDLFSENYIILIINSNTTKEEILEKLSNEGINFELDEALKILESKNLRKGLYKIDKNKKIEDILKMIVNN